MATHKARHAFGSLENIDSALLNNKIDAYDILFVKDANGKPYVGWIDKDGNKVVVSDEAEIAALETELAKKASAEDVQTVEAKIDAKADVTEVEELLSAKADADAVAALETQIATKITAEEVKTMIKESEDSLVEIVEF